MQTPKTKTFYDWYFISIYKINRTLHYFAHSWEILSAREDKIRIPKRPCTVLYMFTPHDDWAIIRVGTLSSSAWYGWRTRVLSLITFLLILCHRSSAIVRNLIFYMVNISLKKALRYAKSVGPNKLYGECIMIYRINFVSDCF